MARRNLLTRDERERLFLPRTDHFSIIRNYTLASEDLDIIGKRCGFRGERARCSDLISRGIPI